MEKTEWDSLEALADWQLMDFSTEKDNSQRKHAAMHILAMRRNRAMERVTMYSAIAAFFAAIAAFAQLLK